MSIATSEDKAKLESYVAKWEKIFVGDPSIEAAKERLRQLQRFKSTCTLAHLRPHRDLGLCSGGLFPLHLCSRKPASSPTFLPYLKPGRVLTRTLGRTALRFRLPLGTGLPSVLSEAGRCGCSPVPACTARGERRCWAGGPLGFFPQAFPLAMFSEGRFIFKVFKDHGL